MVVLRSSARGAPDSAQNDDADSSSDDDDASSEDDEPTAAAASVRVLRAPPSTSAAAESSEPESQESPLPNKASVTVERETANRTCKSLPRTKLFGL